MTEKILLIIITLISILLLCSRCNAEYSASQIANAIYRAEGGGKTKYPYGILKKYKNTTPRQACLNTIQHAKRDWNGTGDFIEFLSKRYAPIPLL